VTTTTVDVREASERTLAEVGGGERGDGEEWYEAEVLLPEDLGGAHVIVAHPVTHCYRPPQILVHIWHLQHVLVHSTHDLHACSISCLKSGKR
jgi:hypothetical protein